MASDSTSSASTSPLPLTPESTGTSFNTFLNNPNPDQNTTTDPSTPKKSRRPAAFYPSASKPGPKPFSRSAAKRESVLALGSIEHLQHFFTKTGLAAKKKPFDKPHHGLVPAIGGSSHVPTSPSISSMNDILSAMPPSPTKPLAPLPIFSTPHVRSYEVDPDELVLGVIHDLEVTEALWGLKRGGSRRGVRQGNDEVLGDGGRGEEEPFDVLEVLKATTKAIRSTRNYILSLPDEYTGAIRTHFRPTITTPSPIPVPISSVAGSGSVSGSTSTSASTSTIANSSSPQKDPIALIRKSALEVLIVLRQLEETARLALTDEAYATAAAALNDQRTASPAPSSSDTNNVVTLAIPSENLDADSSFSMSNAMAFSVVRVNGRHGHEDILVWDEEEDDWSDHEEKEKEERKRRDRWDERLGVGNGWLYRSDLTLSDLEKERRAVAEYLDVVDEVLFESASGERKQEGERGWRKVQRKREGRASSRNARRRVSTGDTQERGGLGVPFEGEKRRRVSMGGMISEEPEEFIEDEEQVDDEELPEWAKRSTFADDPLGRAHALIQTYLPTHLQPALASSTSRHDFLKSLSSGQLLCFAYNGCIRQSRNPWGFVSKDGVHDIIGLEKAASAEAREKESKTWTFRRIDNLRLWAGALKLRYTLPIQLPSQPIAASASGSTSSSKVAATLASMLTSSNRLSSWTSNNGSGSTSGSTFNSPLSSPGKAQFLLPNHTGVRGSYLQLPMNIGHSTTTNPNSTLGGEGGGGEGEEKKKTREPPLLFNARVVAKHEEGWEDMLESVLFRWVDKALDEVRVLSLRRTK